MKSHEHIVLPLDVPDIARAVHLVELLKNDVGVFKVGLELLYSGGSPIDTLDRLRLAGAAKIFLDAKLHDIPNTISGAMRGIARTGAWCVTAHTMGGSTMLQAAVEAARCEAEAQGLPRPLVLGVTVLTSLNEAELTQELCVDTGLATYATHLATMALKAGCDGVISAPSEIQAIRSAIPDSNFLIITPGIRPAGSAAGDQARINTPAEAIIRGASHLVIGRPITAAPDPVDAARRIAREIEGAWNLV